jgi:hypothetical protein
MNVEIGTETPIFLFWEYLFRNFGILSLQCELISASFNSHKMTMNLGSDILESDLWSTNSQSSFYPLVLQM